MPCLSAQTFKLHQPHHTMLTTTLTDIAQIVMDFAVPIGERLYKEINPFKANGGLFIFSLVFVGDEAVGDGR